MRSAAAARRTLLLVCLATSPATAATYTDVLDAPSRPSALATQRLLNGVTVAGERIVAAGTRGHILFSDDGVAWKQAAVPVSSDLTAVSFPTPAKGWAVGHDGVVLASADGGRTWHRQLDGVAAARLTAAQIQASAAAEAKRLLAEGADKPFLDVWFENEREGYVVGAFNLAFRTRDGGATWEPLYERIDNPPPWRYHLYAVRGAAGEVYIAGERGLVLRLDRSTDRFVALRTGYEGSFFGLVVRRDVVIAFGLRGNVYRSADGGRVWRRVDIGTAASVTAGAALPDGRIVLVTSGGDVLASGDAGNTFAPVAIGRPMAWSGVSGAGRSGLALVGLEGVRVHALR